MTLPIGKRSFLAAAAVALLVAAASGGSRLAGWIAATSIGPGAEIGHISANPIDGRVTITGIRLPLADGIVLRIGELTSQTSFALVTPAFAAEDLTLKNVSVDAGGISYLVPEIGFVGSSLTQKDFASYLDKTAKRPFAERIATLSARTIVVPQVRIERKATGGTQVIVLRNLTLRDIAAGKAGTVTAESGTVQGPPPVDIVFGAVNGRGFDLALAAHQLNENPVPERDAKLLVATMTIDKIAFQGTDDLRVEVGRIAANDAKLQPGDRTAHILPFLGTFKIQDGNVDFPSAKVPGGRLKWTLKEFTLTADALRDNVPTKFLATVTELAMLVPPSSDDPTMKNLIDLGYTALVFSLAAETNWNPQTSEFAVKQVAVGGADIGSIVLSGILGKVTKDVFAADQTKSQAALKSATVKTMNLAIENKGLYEHAIARDARKKGKSLEEARRELAVASTATINAIMAGNSDNRALSAAFAKFAVKPSKLVLSVRSKNPAGVPLSDFSESKETRAAIEGKLDISATAE